jgi:hypothetical protein
MRAGASFLFAAALALTSCAPAYDCRSKAVQERLFAILRDNFYDVSAKSDGPALRGVATLAGIAGLVAGVAEMAKQPEGFESGRVLKELRAFPQAARFSLNSLTEEGGDRGKRQCRANVHIEATLPDELADAMRQLPFLGVDAKGVIGGDIDVRFTVQPDLSGKSDVVVRASW